MNPRLFIGFLLATSTAGAQQLTTTEVARIDSVFAHLNSTSGPGCALGIARDGNLIYSKGYGMANLETGTAITPASIFQWQALAR
jgi:CubicO group peptidase (beta-lactamase class C family)